MSSSRQQTLLHIELVAFRQLNFEVFRKVASCVMVLWGLVNASAEAQQPGLLSSRMVKVNGYEVHVKFSGLENRKQGGPVVVFEAGATNSLEVWANVLPQVASFVPVIAYDRAGLGKSAWDNTTPTPKHVWNRFARS